MSVLSYIKEIALTKILKINKFILDLINWVCRHSELNRGPTDYESVALPLSYVGFW